MEERKQVHRTVPRKDSLRTLGKGYPDKLTLFQLDASPYWWVRYFTQGKVIKKTTKTTDLRVAKEFAKNFYTDILLREKNLLPVSQSPIFRKCAEALLAEQETRIRRGELNSKLNINDKSLLKAHIYPFFENIDVRSITYKHLNEFLGKLADADLAPASQQKHLALISKILKHAHREGYLERLPPLPTIKQKDTPRGWFSREEYEVLKETARLIVHDKEQTHTVLRQRITYEMQYLIWFMVNTFLRPSDVKLLKHRHIEVVSGKHSFLRIFTDSSKTTNRPIVSMPAAVRVYQDLVKEHEKSAKSVGKEHYIFFPEISDEKDRWKAMDRMSRQFDYIVKAAELKTSPTGEERTLYSLRHTAIMFRLTMGDLDLLTLARNARTSVEMIERFYANHLTPEMNVEKIHSMRETVVTAKSAAPKKEKKSASNVAAKTLVGRN
jgi:site-specific recombinase XerD